MPSPTKAATTFIQTDRATFRDLVQKLTGLSSPEAQNLPNLAAPLLKLAANSTAPRRSPFKLQERRHAMRNKIEIKLGLITSAVRDSPSHPRPKSRRLDSCSHLAPSPVTPLGSELSIFFFGGITKAEEVEERSPFAEKGYYLHPSPVTTPRGSEPPELLPLFPLTSPKEAKQRGRCS